MKSGKRSGWLFSNPELQEQVDRVALMNMEQNGHLIEKANEEQVLKVKKKERKRKRGGYS